MSTGECMLLCEGDDIDEKLVYAQDLIAFLADQVGSKNVDTVLMAPEPVHDSTPLISTSHCKSRGRLERRLSSPSKGGEPRTASAPGGKAQYFQTFYIGDGDPGASRPGTQSEKLPAGKTDSTVSGKNEKLFFIGEIKPARSGRHGTKEFFIGEGSAPQQEKTSSPKRQQNTRRQTSTPISASDAMAEYNATFRRKSTTAACTTPRKMRNLLTEDSPASTVCAESSGVQANHPDAELDTPVKRFIGLSRIVRQEPRQEKEPRQPARPEAWKKWACTLGCTGREVDEEQKQMSFISAK